MKTHTGLFFPLEGLMLVWQRRGRTGIEVIWPRIADPLREPLVCRWISTC